jgi:glycosyltransferase involved in cell wall biosynthesis
VWAGSSIYRPVRRLFRGDRAPWSKLESADAIEFQWSEMIALAPLVRRYLPGKKLIGVAHDVITQRWERQAAANGSAIRRPLERLAAARSRRREAASFSALDLLVVLSEKDAALARELAPATRVEVVHPGLGPTDPLPRAPRPDEPEVLFTGALNRPENWSAILWFIDEMWDRVLREVPSARLIIAGANPPEALKSRVARTARAELTGFVESLEPWYARASVFAVPLRQGAGVKFKTIDAMLRGVPIVTTAVGAEGIDASELFAEVTDDAGRFAAAVVRQLRDPELELAERAQRWADGVYGVEAFERRIEELYGDFLSE